MGHDRSDEESDNELQVFDLVKLIKNEKFQEGDEERVSDP